MTKDKWGNKHQWTKIDGADLMRFLGCKCGKLHVKDFIPKLSDGLSRVN